MHSGKMFKSTQILNRYYSRLSTNFKEIKIPVPWGHIAAKWWNPSDQRPIIAIHGWLDSAGSFDRLIPKLNRNVGVLAIDLPGHGYSSRLPPGIFYHTLIYVHSLKLIGDYFKWDKLSLLGHSIGGMASYLYAILYPENLDFMILMENIKPVYKVENLARLARGFIEFDKYSGQAESSMEPPCYTMEDLKLKQVQGGAINLNFVHHILDRNVEASKIHPNKFYWSRDPRLKSRIILNWPHRELMDGAFNIRCPLLIMKFTESGYYEQKSNFYDIVRLLKVFSSDCRFHYVEGNHHTHLNNPERCEGLVNKFLDDYYDSENRDGGRILQDFLK